LAVLRLSPANPLPQADTHAARFGFAMARHLHVSIECATGRTTKPETEHDILA